MAKTESERIVAYILIINLFLFTACQNKEHNTIVHSKNSYKEGFVEDERVKLHYLDWGGNKEALVMITGWGDTPYLFGELAKELSDKFHVIGYSRRSHGKSIAKDEKYDTETLVADLKTLLDSLHIDKANLLGWSMGGNEITEFVIRYPERTSRLIYLEAGYDLSDSVFSKILSQMPQSFIPGKEDLSSIDAYRKWYHRLWFPDVEWNDVLEANLRASINISPDSSIRTIPDDAATRAVLREAMNYHRPYDRVTAPALVIFTHTFFEAPQNDPATRIQLEKLEKEIIGPWRQQSINRVKAELKKAKVKILPQGSHVSLIFLSREPLVKSIADFLGN